MKNLTMLTSDPTISYVPSGLALFPFQKSGVDFLCSRKRALLASDAGTGKTVMLIAAANKLNLENKGLTVLVLCPKSVRLNWEREIKKWALGSYIHWEVRNWDQLIHRVKSKEILLGGEGKSEGKARSWDLVIADESHVAIKNPDAKRAKVFIEKLVPSAKRVWLATATPASTSGFDYYGTLEVLLPTLMCGWSKLAFKQRFCEEKRCRRTPGGLKYEGFKNTKELREVFSKISIRHRKEEVLKDLPPKIYTDLYIEVDSQIVADNLNLDVQLVEDSIASGRPLPGHIAHVMQANALAKLASALEWIENFPNHESLVIFAWHKAVITALSRETAGTETITGETSEVERQFIVDSFQEGTIKRVICNMVAGGVGITLTKAQTALFIEFPHSPIYLVQAENRVHRIGSVGEHIQIVRMLGAGTVDERIFSVLDKRIEKLKEVEV